MTKIVSFHSFLRGAGKSTLTANVAALLAARGHIVGVIDADISAPALHVLFGWTEDGECQLNDYLRGKCGILEAVHDVTANLGAPVSGRVLLVPACDDPGEIARWTRESYNFDPLSDSIQQIFDHLGLDILLLDVPSGLSEASLSLLALSDATAVVLRLDKQDYQGTAVTLGVARQLGIPRVTLVVNLVSHQFDLEEVKARVVHTYGCEEVIVLPHADEVMALSSAAIFALRYPHHPITALLNQIADSLVE
jgi:septum site-determining protein MinD